MRCLLQDEAARRRLVKKLYIPLPDYASRMQLLKITMAKDGVDHRLSEEDFVNITQKAAGYSGSDMAALCTEASMGPIRSMSSTMDTDDISRMEAANVRPIEMTDFDAAFQSIRPSVNQKDLAQYIASVGSIAGTHGSAPVGNHPERRLGPARSSRHVLCSSSFCNCCCSFAAGTNSMAASPCPTERPARQQQTTQSRKISRHEVEPLACPPCMLG